MDPFGGATIDIKIGADGIGDVAGFVQQPTAIGGIRTKRQNPIPVASAQGENPIAGADQGNIQWAAAMGRQVEAVFPSDLDGFGTGRKPRRGHRTRGKNLIPELVDCVNVAVEIFGQPFLGKDFGHRAAAGVAGADKQDAGQREIFDIGPEQTPSRRMSKPAGVTRRTVLLWA